MGLVSIYKNMKLGLWCLLWNTSGGKSYSYIFCNITPTNILLFNANQQFQVSLCATKKSCFSKSLAVPVGFFFFCAHTRQTATSWAVRVSVYDLKHQHTSLCLMFFLFKMVLCWHLNDQIKLLEAQVVCGGYRETDLGFWQYSCYEIPR